MEIFQSTVDSGKRHPLDNTEEIALGRSARLAFLAKTGNQRSDGLLEGIDSSLVVRRRGSPEIGTDWGK
jgi:hypothetical protein